MKELVIISGKGGTGKTSVVASLAHLAGEAVLADCDVDAADLHLILHPDIQEDTPFFSGKVAEIRSDRCTGCGKCTELCRFSAISENYVVDPISCEGCGVCAWFCPEKAVNLVEKEAGRWFRSESRYGPLFHAKLNVAEDNSGKLVTQVKDTARIFARDNGYERLIVDGPPGVGCPVISSVSGANMLLVVTEPTVSGLHDLKRVLELAAHFKIKAMVCINRYDINEEMSGAIASYCNENSVPVAGRVPYDTDVTLAQLEGKSVVEYSRGPAAEAIRTIWDTVSLELQ